MSRRPGSLQARLLLWGIGLTALAIIIAGLTIGWIIERFVVGQIDGQLDARTAAISDVLTDRGIRGVNENLRSTYDPTFDRAHQGWFWQIFEQEPGGLNSLARSNTDEVLALSGLDPLRNANLMQFLDPTRPFDGVTTRGSRVHARVRSVSLDGKLYLVIAAAPRAAVLGAVWQLIWPVSVSILLLGFGLTAAITLQVRLGLRPLRRLERDIANVRSGGATKLPFEQPFELASLVSELNQLIEHNQLGLDAARRQVANLAHGLKTPLASIQLELENLDMEAKRGLLIPVNQIDRHLRYHLSRARANAMSGTARERILLGPAVIAIAEALKKLFAERGLQFSISIDEKIRVICEHRDFDEIVGNVLENACKWAKGRIAITARADPGRVAVHVEDDGSGVPDGKLADVLKPGERLDTVVRGDGFGLAIVQELIEIHAGSIELERSLLGGLRVELTFKAP